MAWTVAHAMRQCRANREGGCGNAFRTRLPFVLVVLRGCRSASATELAAPGFALCTLLLQLGSLFCSQDCDHFLPQFELLAHHFRLQSSFLRKYLRGQCFIERTALLSLTQLLMLGTELFT